MTRLPRGMTLVEILLASLIAPVILVLGYLVVAGGMTSVTWMRAADEGHADFHRLHETLGRDIQAASSVVKEVSLDGTVYRTMEDGEREQLVLRLPAVTAQGQTLAGVHDFVVYTVSGPRGGPSVIERLVEPNRDAAGRPVVLVTGSGRRSQRHVLSRALRRPPAHPSPQRIFHCDQPIVELAQAIEVRLLVQPAALRRTFRADRLRDAQGYTVTFRLRNG